jgi:hypothetical protein
VRLRHLALVAAATVLTFSGGCTAARTTPVATVRGPASAALHATPAAVAVAAPEPTVPEPPARSVDSGAAGVPMATGGDVTLVHPAALVERVGFHQSNHEGARSLDAAATAVRPIILPARDRLTPPATAVDVVVDPATPVLAPASGRVKRAGSYTLYCKYADDYVVIEPDQHPGWEVKVLHIDGLDVRRGTRVEAGVTVLADHVRQLPFASQVDDARTADPAWPHVHVEVVDPAIPNVPSPGGGC